MNIIKRSGEEVAYNGLKIILAVQKANAEVPTSAQMSDKKIEVVEDEVRKRLEDFIYAPTVEEIQDLVIAEIGRLGHFVVQQEYSKYRYKREMVRKSNSTDDSILALLERGNEELKQENSNKNVILNSTQRDYMAGEVSKDLTRRILLPREISDAHDDGVIHFHNVIVALTA